MNRIKYLIISIFLFLIPIYVNASTILLGSNKQPTIGSIFEVNVNIDYGKTKIKTAHYVISYDPSCFSLSEITWATPAISYRNEEGKLYMDKEATTPSWSTGSPFTLLFRANKECSSTIEISETDKATDDNDQIINQSFANIPIKTVESNTNNQLASLKVTNYKLNSTFDKAVNNYSTTVDKDIDNVEIVVKKNESKQTITSNGTIPPEDAKSNTVHISYDLQYGLNKIYVYVKSESGDTNTYVVMVTRTEEEKKYANLKRLTVSNTNIVLVKDKYNYEARVPKSIDSIFITAFPEDEKAELTGTGNKKIIDGENKFEIEVKSSTGDIKKYTINIIRTDEVTATSNTNIKSIKINGEKKEFKNNQILIGVADKTKNIKIDLTLEGENASYTIEGNNELHEGINTIIINVTDGTNSKNYYIRAYKKDSGVVIVKDINDISKIVINTIVESDENDKHEIPKKKLELLQNTSKTLYYNVLNEDLGLLYQLAFNHDLEPDNIIGDIEKESDKPLTFKSEISANVKILLFLDTEEFSDGEFIRIYSYDDNNNYKLVQKSVSINNGYVEFISNGDKHYVFTKDTLIKEDSPTTILFKQYKDYIYIGSGILGLIIIVLIITKISKKKKKVVEQKI